MSSGSNTLRRRSVRKLRASVAESFLRVLTCVVIACILRAMELRVKYVFGSDLRAERERRHLTQEEAAAQVGVSTRTWQLWERGQEVVPRAKHRRALVDWIAQEEAA
jgi:hypothetical protein